MVAINHEPPDCFKRNRQRYFETYFLKHGPACYYHFVSYKNNQVPLEMIPVRPPIDLHVQVTTRSWQFNMEPLRLS